MVMTTCSLCQGACGGLVGRTSDLVNITSTGPCILPLKAGDLTSSAAPGSLPSWTIILTLVAMILFIASQAYFDMFYNPLREAQGNIDRDVR